MASGLGSLVRWGQYNSFESVGAVRIVGGVSEREEKSSLVIGRWSLAKPRALSCSRTPTFLNGGQYWGWRPTT